MADSVHVQGDADATKEKLRAARLSLIINFLLILIKLVVALLTGSLAILAELMHSFFDMLASFFAYLGIRKADEPADESHQFGHEKFENLSSLAQTVLIVLTSLFIMWEAAQKIMDPAGHEVKETTIGLGVMFFSMIVAHFVSKYLGKVSEEHGSAALEADAAHFKTDLWGAIAVIIGLLFVILGYPIFDAVAALFVAVLMLWISYHLGMKSIHVLTDKSPHASIISDIEGVILSTPKVSSYHKLKVRQAGSKLFLEMHIQVDPAMSVAEGHNVAHDVKEKLSKKFQNLKEATIHVEPSGLDNEGEKDLEDGF